MQGVLKSFREFKLSGMAANLETRITYANNHKLPSIELLELLCDDEVATRKDNNYKKRLKAAKLPFHKKIEDFDFSFQSSVAEQQINDIATCRFITEKQNLILIGNSGTGKTHIAIGLALKALAREYKVLFTTVSDMLYNLHIAKADNSYQKKLEQLIKCDLLVLDELGFRSLPKYSADDFFNIISKRYESASTIITTNKDFKEWQDIFVDEVLSKAIIDRVMHHGIALRFKGNSYRTRNININGGGMT